MNNTGTKPDFIATFDEHELIQTLFEQNIIMHARIDALSSVIAVVCERTGYSTEKMLALIEKTTIENIY